MKKQITLILLAISILVIVFILVYGIKIGKFEVLSIKQFINKDKDLNDKILLASEVTSIKYPEAQKKLEDAYERMKVQKQKYEEKSSANAKETKEVYESKEYDIVYLWKVIGTSAAKRNLKIAMKVESTNVKDLYNLNFTVTGYYSNIIEFISKDLEDNSDLYFRIYNFKMNGESITQIPEYVTSEFTVKNINIDPDTILEDNLSTTLDNTNKTNNTENK